MPSLIGYIFGDNPRNFLYLYLKKMNSTVRGLIKRFFLSHKL